MNRILTCKIVPFFVLLAFTFFLVPATVDAKNINATYASDNVMWFSTGKLYKRTSGWGDSGMWINFQFLKTLTENNTSQYYFILSRSGYMTAKYYPYEKNATLVINNVEYPLAQMEKVEAITALDISDDATVFPVPDTLVKQLASLKAGDTVVLLIPSASKLVTNSFTINNDNIDGMVKIIAATRTDFALYDEWAEKREQLTR